MGSLRKFWQDRLKPDREPPAEKPGEEEVGYNPSRDEQLYWLTEDGYIIAQDVICQYEYVQLARCLKCGGRLKIAAHLNRAGQGLSELVALCLDCGARANFIFDISNDVYQMWWEEQLGPLYVRQFDDPPREPVVPE